MYVKNTEGKISTYQFQKKKQENEVKKKNSCQTFWDGIAKKV